MECSSYYILDVSPKGGPYRSYFSCRVFSISTGFTIDNCADMLLQIPFLADLELCFEPSIIRPKLDLKIARDKLFVHGLQS